MGFSYTTGTVARLAGVTSDTLRDWLREGHLAEPPRNQRNHRVFGVEHVSRVMDLAGFRARRRISIVNQKGGVGKTTAVFNLGAGLAFRGRKFRTGEQDKTISDVRLDVRRNVFWLALEDGRDGQGLRTYRPGTPQTLVLNGAFRPLPHSRRQGCERRFGAV